MTHLTIAVEENLLEEAQERARQQGTSIEELLRRYLESFVDAEQQERQDERGPGAEAHDLARGVDLAGGCRAERREDAGADHGADRQHHEVAGPEGALHPSPTLVVGDQVGDALACEE